MRKRMLYHQCLDVILDEIKLRFIENQWLHHASEALSRKSSNFLDRSALLPLSRLLIEIPSIAELEVAKQYLADNVPISDKNDSSIVLKSLNEMKTAFPKVYNLAAVAASFGSSTAVCECSFSTLAKVNAPQRRSMLQRRQRNLDLLAFERDRTRKIDLDAFVLRFSKRHTRMRLVKDFSVFWLTL